MFEKIKLKKQVKKCAKQIKTIEQKRSRSQAALVTAILSHSTPDETDVEYFNRYTEQIELTRQKMHNAENQLKEL